MALKFNIRPKTWHRVQKPQKLRFFANFLTDAEYRPSKITKQSLSPKNYRKIWDFSLLLAYSNENPEKIWDFSQIFTDFDRYWNRPKSPTVHVIKVCELHNFEKIEFSDNLCRIFVAVSLCPILQHFFGILDFFRPHGVQKQKMFLSSKVKKPALKKIGFWRKFKILFPRDFWGFWNEICVSSRFSKNSFTRNAISGTVGEFFMKKFQIEKRKPGRVCATTTREFQTLPELRTFRTHFCVSCEKNKKCRFFAITFHFVCGRRKMWLTVANLGIIAAI